MSVSKAAVHATCGVMLIVAATLAPNAPITTATARPRPATATGPGPGDMVTVGRLGVVVPKPGHIVEIYSEFADGTSDSLVVETTEDGQVLINPDPPTQRVATTSSTLRGGTGECADGYTAYDSQSKWTGPMDWWFNSPSLPSSLTLSAVTDDLRSGTRDVTQENNNCGRADNMSGSANWQGTNSNGVNISTDNQCLSDDGVSEVSFGTLPNNIVASTCNWDVAGMAPHRTESDIKLNKQDYDWTTGYCGGQFSSAHYVEGIMAHERGHTFNAKDFPTGHPNMTMGGANSQCPGADEKQTLGLGDMLSLEARY
jgi:hypothetical protein